MCGTPVLCGVTSSPRQCAYTLSRQTSRRRWAIFDQSKVHLDLPYLQFFSQTQPNLAMFCILRFPPTQAGGGSIADEPVPATCCTWRRYPNPYRSPSIQDSAYERHGASMWQVYSTRHPFIWNFEGFTSLTDSRVLFTAALNDQWLDSTTKQLQWLPKSFQWWMTTHHTIPRSLCFIIACHCISFICILSIGKYIYICTPIYMTIFRLFFTIVRLSVFIQGLKRKNTKTILHFPKCTTVHFSVY